MASDTPSGQKRTIVLTGASDGIGAIAARSLAGPDTDLVLVLTAGGPANSTVTLGLLSYRQAFQQFEFGLGGAYGMLLLVISVLFAIVYTVMSMRRERDE